MKKMIVSINVFSILVISMFSSLLFAGNVEDVKIDTRSLARQYLDEVRACEKDIMACPRNYNPRDLNNNPNLLSAEYLNSILAKDKERSIFIPLELNNSELITLAAATSLGVVAFKYDQEILDTIQRNDSKVANMIESVGNFYGSGFGMGAVAAGSYFLGMYYDNNQLKKVGLFIVGTEIAQAIVTAAVKNTIGRSRPSEDQGPYTFFQAGSKSFYSGHTATAFALATVVTEMYKDDYPVVPYVVYGLAALTAYARVHGNNHWPSDVIAGAVAGHLIAKLAMSAFSKESDRGGLKFYPSFDPRSGTVMANFEWTPKIPEEPLKCSKMPDGESKIRACFEEALNKPKR